MKIQKRIEINLDKPGFSYPVKVVQYDTGIQLIFTISNFEIPDGTTVTVFFLKPSGKFVYQEKNITISGNEITVDVENQAFTEKGLVEYQVALTNGDDLITSFSRIVQVEKSLTNSGAEESKTVIAAFDTLTAEKIADIQAAALDEIAAAKQAIEAKKDAVLASIPDDYTEMGNNVDYLFNQVANAIKNNVSGSVIAVNDVSPITHKPVVNVHGKNFFDGSLLDGVLANNSFATDTVANSNYKSIKIYLRKGVYTLSMSRRVYMARTILDDLYSIIGIYLDSNNPHTFRVNRDGYVGFSFRLDPLEAWDNTTTIQIEEGETATEYTPYIDLATVSVMRCGKNLIPYPYNEATLTRGGIKFTVSENGQITASGTSTGAYLLVITAANKKVYLHEGQTYFFSGVPSGGGYNTYYGYVAEDDGETFFDLGSGVVVTPTKSGYASITYVVKEGTTVSNVVFKPQLETGGAATGFEVYNGSEYTPIEDGSIEGITSVSPNMTIFANTAGIIVDCEYNVDTKKYIDNSKSTGVLLTDTVTGKVYELKITDGHVIAEGVS